MGGFVKATIDADKFQQALRKLPGLFRTETIIAGKQAADFVLDQKGLRTYPAETSANEPPEPYYIRGRGTQRTSRAGVSYNDNSSEQYGSQWSIKAKPMRVTIGNPASYAPFLAGDKDQARAMRRIGWQKLVVVARKSMSAIKNIYSLRIRNAIRKAGFRL